MESAAKKFKEDKDANSLNSLREKYINAHMAWQRVEMINIGKAEEIYYNSKMNVYPVNTARVTSNISSGSYDFNNANNNAMAAFLLNNGAAKKLPWGPRGPQSGIPSPSSNIT